ncbi:Homeodomain-like protein [Xylariaceae sp. FL1651]|nr:Homeodomain-like protein [Xylariaceae sp. FL1651]
MSSQRRGPWSQREDELLMRLVQQQGPLNWVKISQLLHSRTPKQCRERYHQNLKPSLNHEPISTEEGQLIEKLVQQLGKRWAEIARRLNNRSDNAVKNWWNGSMNRRKRMIRRKAPGGYEDSTLLAYPRGPEPLRLSTVPSAYPTHPLYESISPSSGRFSHSIWNIQSGLPSPSTTSPGADSLDGPPSLMSDASSLYSTSPTATFPPESPIALPPLRCGSTDAPTSPAFGASQMLPPLSSRHHDMVRLPPIRHCVESHNQLPTAPNSPLELAMRPAHHSTPNMGRDDPPGETNARMKLSSILG